MLDRLISSLKPTLDPDLAKMKQKAKECRTRVFQTLDGDGGREVARAMLEVLKDAKLG